MEFKQIQELIKAVNKSTVSELTIKDGEFEITIKQATSEGIAMPMTQFVPGASHPPVGPAPVDAPPAAPSNDGLAENQKLIKAPMIGTFYRSSSPDKAPFINIGDDVKAGDVVCILEAMKLFNEIESEISGKIVKVLVDDGTPVEYDQPLFIIE
ncbi:MAG TPA: acetyl-CoA carboxylase biotin carboxyl carrier protein [Edaphocola sp.]|nr:acetyl-CoA carboxylase biotin carboxyl carrier protein [Edaphocola sp.]